MHLNVSVAVTVTSMLVMGWLAEINLQGMFPQLCNYTEFFSLLELIVFFFVGFVVSYSSHCHFQHTGSENITLASFGSTMAMLASRSIRNRSIKETQEPNRLTWHIRWFVSQTEKGSARNCLGRQCIKKYLAVTVCHGITSTGQAVEHYCQQSELVN